MFPASTWKPWLLKAANAYHAHVRAIALG